MVGLYVPAVLGTYQPSTQAERMMPLMIALLLIGADKQNKPSLSLQEFSAKIIGITEEFLFFRQAFFVRGVQTPPAELDDLLQRFFVDLALEGVITNRALPPRPPAHAWSQSQWSSSAESSSSSAAEINSRHPGLI